MPDTPVGGYPPLKWKPDPIEADEPTSCAFKAKKFRQPDLAQIPEEIAKEVEDIGASLCDLQASLDANGSDGATVALDFCEPCAWLHDALYRSKAVARATADRLYRRCIFALGREDEAWNRPFYWFAGWLYWAGVRAFGGRAR